MSTELKTLSRANSEIEEPTPDQHLMAIVAGSLQRIADALEQSSAKPQADELAELRCQVKGMGQMVDLHAGSVPRIDREHMALRIEHQRLFKRIERIVSHLAGPMATWDAQGIIQSPDSPEVPDRLGGAEGEPDGVSGPSRADQAGSPGRKSTLSE